MSCLHQLQKENRNLENQVKKLERRREHLLAVTARLSAGDFSATSSTTAAEGGSSSSGASTVSVASLSGLLAPSPVSASQPPPPPPSQSKVHPTSASSTVTIVTTTVSATAALSMSALHHQRQTDATPHLKNPHHAAAFSASSRPQPVTGTARL